MTSSFFLALTKPRGMLCPNGTVKPFLVSLVEPVAYLKSELVSRCALRRRDVIAYQLHPIIFPHQVPSTTAVDTSRTRCRYGFLSSATGKSRPSHKISGRA